MATGVPKPASASSSAPKENAMITAWMRWSSEMAEVLAFYDDFGRGMHGMQLPYAASCFRAQVLDRVTPTLTDKQTAEDGDGVVSDGSSTDMLLIDFH